MQDTHDVMPVNVLIPQKLKPKTTRLRCYLARAYPLKKDEVEKKIFYGLHPAAQSYAHRKKSHSRSLMLQHNSMPIRIETLEKD